MKNNKRIRIGLILYSAILLLIPAVIFLLVSGLNSLYPYNDSSLVTAILRHSVVIGIVCLAVFLVLLALKRKYFVHNTRYLNLMFYIVLIILASAALWTFLDVRHLLGFPSAVYKNPRFLLYSAFKPNITLRYYLVSPEYQIMIGFVTQVSVLLNFIVWLTELWLTKRKTKHPKSNFSPT